MKIQILPYLCALFFWGTTTAQAQDRYVDTVFEEVEISSGVVYSDVTNYIMDIYQPVGDDLAERPLLIFAHGGSFVGGTTQNPTAVGVCTEFAKRGYVTASIQYQLADFAAQLVDSLVIMDVVMKAVGDANAAIRFFNKDAATDNMYRTDADRVFIGGNSAGAILALHNAYLDETDTIPDNLWDAINNNGGIEGNRGNEGYSREVKGVMSLAGGLNVLSLISADEVPTFSAHGDADGIVPYDCNDIYWNDSLFGALDLVDVCGSSEIHPILDSFGIDNELITYEGEDHVPWSEVEPDTEILSNIEIFTEVVQKAADFLAPYATEETEIPASITNGLISGWKVYPNPSFDRVNILFDNTDSGIIRLTDMAGKQVFTSTMQNANKSIIDVSALQAGMYLLNFEGREHTFSQLMVVE